MWRWFLVGMLVCGCGETPGGSGSQPFFETLRYIQENGFPKFADIWPGLPSQFALATGVDTDATGLPALPSNLSGTGLGKNTSDFTNLLGDARQLSAQGFSEARRLEANLQNVLSPVFDALSRADLFTEVAGIAPTAGQGLQAGEPATVANIFESMFDNFSFGVNLEDIEGMPSYLVFNASTSSEFITVSGLWEDSAQGDQFYTGFQTRFRINSLNDMDVSFAVQPGLLSGLVGEWKAGNCSDDIYRVQLSSSLSDGRSVTVSTNECPSTRNSIASLGITALDGTFTFKGGFVQTYDADESSLRGFLGARQGFVLQATAGSELDKVAAAAAVLGESDFDNPTQETVDNFGVGRLVSRFLQAKYWSPNWSDARGISPQIPTSGLDNIAYWMCFNSIVSPLISTAESSALCDNSEIPIDGFINSLGELRTDVNEAAELADGLFPIPGLSSGISATKTTLNGIIDILSIRNGLFLATDGTVSYKDAPDEEFQNLEAIRSNAGLAQLNDLSWTTELNAQLVTLSRDELPSTPFASVTGRFADFLGQSCNKFLKESAGKAGKEVATKNRCQF